MNATSMSAVRTSQAATAADDMTAVQRLQKGLKGIRNDSLSFADEQGFDVQLMSNRDDSIAEAAPTEEVDQAVERAEEKIVTNRATDVFALQGTARDAATTLLTP